MRKHLLAAGIAAAALMPSFALAQQTCEQQQNNRVAGTVVGAGLGALLGSAIAGHGDKTTGAVIGGIGGAVVGNQVAKSNTDCSRAYGYYDNNGAWHASSVARANAAGYYDRNGNWVNGAPNGYYNNDGRWVTASNNASASGYYDANGRWVPASASGYYDTNGQYVTASASGYYDSRGRWVAGPATGRYDANGRWIPGEASGHRDARGMWVADAQTGYYDSNGRWRAGPVMGYYDAQGRWTSTAPAAGSYGANASYEARSNWIGAPADVREREAWLDQRIRNAMNDGTLGRRDANRALRSLDAIRREEMSMRRYRGELSPRNEAQIQAKLDDLNNNLRWSRRDDQRRY
ncbi:MAG: glycine zipper 2TM domain-containing protein [Phenylobacterium sp.]